MLYLLVRYRENSMPKKEAFSYFRGIIDTLFCVHIYYIYKNLFGVTRVTNILLMYIYPGMIFFTQDLTVMFMIQILSLLFYVERWDYDFGFAIPTDLVAILLKPGSRSKALAYGDTNFWSINKSLRLAGLNYVPLAALSVEKNVIALTMAFPDGELSA